MILFRSVSQRARTSRPELEQNLTSWKFKTAGPRERGIFRSLSAVEEGERERERERGGGRGDEGGEGERESGPLSGLYRAADLVCNCNPPIIHAN